MNTSRIEIYDSNGEKKVIQPPDGREFTGNHRGLKGGKVFTSVSNAEDFRCFTRPLPTAKEQRAEKLSATINHWLVTGKPTTNLDLVADIEAIFAEYPDKEEK